MNYEIEALEDGKILVRYTCERCGKSAERVQSPGFMPKYCGECAKIVTREKATARKQKQRAKQGR